MNEKNALITGISQALFEEGYAVTGVARDFSKLEFDELNKVQIDLSLIDHLADFRRLVDTNLVSTLFLVKHFLPRMKQNGGGDIVLMGSESSLNGAKAGAVYCATKFAIRGLAQSLRADCSTANIRVILVNPGPVESSFFDELNFEPQEGDEFVIPTESVAKAIVSALNQPRSVVVDEVNIQPIKRSFKKK